jgi:hypothetical protein
MYSAKERQWVFEDKGVMEMHLAMGSKYFGDPGVD